MKRDEKTYQRIHRDVRRLWGGPASLHRCFWCFSKADSYSWMWRTGLRQDDLAAYVPLCKSDHDEYDAERLSAIRSLNGRGNQNAKGHTLSAEAKSRCSRSGSRHSEETKAKMRVAQQARRQREFG